MRKIIEWFDGVADPELKKKLLGYLEKDCADLEVESMSRAIKAGFYWTDTEEGFDYWSLHYDKLRVAEGLLISLPKVDEHAEVSA